MWSSQALGHHPTTINWKTQYPKLLATIQLLSTGKIIATKGADSQHPYIQNPQNNNTLIIQKIFQIYFTTEEILQVYFFIIELL
jgi:hypothetical protein